MSEPVVVALDQNFPEPVLRSMEQFIPEAALTPLRKLHPRLPNLDDDELVVALRQLGINVLATNNYKMLLNPKELAAILSTRTTVVAFEKLGHDPIRAAGALLLDLPPLLKKYDPSKPQIFWMRPRSPQPIDPWEQMTTLAERRGTTPADLYDEHRLSEEQLAVNYLDDRL